MRLILVSFLLCDANCREGQGSLWPARLFSGFEAVLRPYQPGAAVQGAQLLAEPRELNWVAYMA